VNEKGKVLDINNGDDRENNWMSVVNQNKSPSQEWDIIYVVDMAKDPVKGELNTDFGLYVERPFHIVSQLPGRRYLDIIDRRNVVIKTPNSYKTQVWYFDQRSRTIKSQSNNESFDIQNAGKNKNLQVYKTNSGWFQLFKYNGGNIVNVKDQKVLDVAGSRDTEGNNVVVWKRHNGLNQRWKVIYLDEMKPEPTKGLDQETGLYRNRAFYIVSRLPAHRVATVQGHNLAITKKKNGDESQLFFFDHLTRTIKSQQFKARSIDIQSSGRGRSVQIWNTNARWW
jgi:hypothetical protein